MEQTKQTLKTLIPYIVSGILILIASFFMKGCHDKPYIDPPKTDNAVLNDFIQRKGLMINTIISNNKVLRDSLFNAKKAKIKIVYRTKTVYDSLLVTDTMCTKTLITLYNDCQKNDSINNIIIDNQSSQIAGLINATNEQQDIIDIQKYRIKQDSLDNVTLKEQLPVQYKQGLKKGRKQGVIIGCAVESAVIIGGLLLVK